MNKRLKTFFHNVMVYFWFWRNALKAKTVRFNLSKENECVCQFQGCLWWLSFLLSSVMVVGKRVGCDDGILQIIVFCLVYVFKVKELGVVIYNCTSLAADLYKIYQSYWVMGTRNATMPDTWPSSYDTSINKEQPLRMNLSHVSSRVYISVKLLFCSLFQFH